MTTPSDSPRALAHPNPEPAYHSPHSRPHRRPGHGHFSNSLYFVTSPPASPLMPCHRAWHIAALRTHC